MYSEGVMPVMDLHVRQTCSLLRPAMVMKPAAPRLKISGAWAALQASTNHLGAVFWFAHRIVCGTVCQKQQELFDPGQCAL